MEQAIAGGAESILLDNMTPAQVKKAVKQIRAALPGVPIEASGNMNLKTVRKYALAGVDFVSVGALTHSAVAAGPEHAHHRGCVLGLAMRHLICKAVEAGDCRDGVRRPGDAFSFWWVRRMCWRSKQRRLERRSGVWVADEQTAGRGRGGHGWHSVAGDGLYVSALVAPIRCR